MNDKPLYKADIATSVSVDVLRLMAALGLKTEDHVERIVLDMSANDHLRMTITRLVDEDQLKALTDELEQHPPKQRELLGVSRNLNPEWTPE